MAIIIKDHWVSAQIKFYSLSFPIPREKQSFTSQDLLFCSVLDLKEKFISQDVPFLYRDKGGSGRDYWVFGLGTIISSMAIHKRMLCILAISKLY